MIDILQQKSTKSITSSVTFSKTAVSFLISSVPAHNRPVWQTYTHRQTNGQPRPRPPYEVTLTTTTPTYEVTRSTTTPPYEVTFSKTEVSFLIWGPGLQNISQQSYDKAKVTIDLGLMVWFTKNLAKDEMLFLGKIHLQNQKVIWGSVHKLASNIPTRNLSKTQVNIVRRSYDIT